MDCKTSIKNRESRMAYYYKNKEKEKEYYLINKDKIKEYKKKYYLIKKMDPQFNISNICECGGKYKTGNLVNHSKTKKHQKFLDNLKN